MNSTVYLGANEGTDPALKTALQELGKWIGESGNALIYGGSRCGLMGVLADSVLAAGGEVTGVEPEFLESVLLAELVFPQALSVRPSATAPTIATILLKPLTVFIFCLLAFCARRAPAG